MKYRAFLGLGAVAALFGQGIGALATLDFRRKERDPALPERRHTKAQAPSRQHARGHAQVLILDRSSTIKKLQRGTLREPTDKVKRRHVHPRWKR